MRNLQDRIKDWVEANPFWAVARVQKEGDDVKIYGWIVTTPERLVDSCIVCNGEPLSDITFTPSSGQQVDRFSYLPKGISNFTFVAETKAASNELEINLHSLSNDEPYNEFASFFWTDWLEGYALPPRDLVVMTAGGYYPYLFNLNGYSTYRNTNKILERIVGKPFSEFESMLDWGCGCGRTTRFIRLEEKAPKLCGADIVNELVDYCKDTYEFGEFSVVQTTPPMAYEDNQFDLVVAMSVLTHIREDQQFDWLKEMVRITRPGATLLLSVHGFNSLVYVGFTQKKNLMKHYDEKGFADAGLCDNLDGHVEDKDYYRNVFHTESYIKREWAKYFEVQDIVTAANARHQDYVVLKRR